MAVTYPLVSVCIPTYNGALYLEECLASVLMQSYKNLEVVISDDASTDNTLEIVKRFQANTDLKVFVYRHEPSGIGANWNHCVKQANGDYIKFLFQDDTLYPDCIEKMVALAISEASIGLVYAKRDFIYDETNTQAKAFVSFYGNLHTYWETISIQNGVLDGISYLKDAQILNSPKNKIGEPTSTLIKKECFDKIGYFNTDMKQALDCEFWYRLMPYYKIGFLDEVLSSFRLHNSQASAKNKAQLVNETLVLYKMFYTTLYRYLNRSNQWKLKKLFHPFYAFLVKLKHSIR